MNPSVTVLVPVDELGELFGGGGVAFDGVFQGVVLEDGDELFEALGGVGDLEEALLFG